MDDRIEKNESSAGKIYVYERMVVEHYIQKLLAILYSIRYA